MRTRRWPRLIAGPALVIGFIVIAAAPAWAHAVPKDWVPAQDSVVAQSPTQLAITFNENVTISPRSLELFTCQGTRISIGTPKHGSAGTIVTASVSNLQPGTYEVQWRVISADSHPVSGGWNFTVGSASAPPTGCATLKAEHSSTTVGVLFGFWRFLLFSGLALLIGGVAFLALIARGSSAAARTRTLVWTGWGLTVFATIASVMFQAPYGAGTGIGDAFKWSTVHDVLNTRYGHIAELRLLLLVIALPVLLYEQRTSVARALHPVWIGAASVVGLLLAATPGEAGHASTGDHTVFAVPLDALHVAAMCIWFGGLAALVVTAIGGGFSGGLRRALVRFSTLATGCVIALVLTGLFASWRQVGFKVRGYLHTSYGNMLLVKLAIVVALVAIAGLSRAIVQRRRAAPLDAPDSAVAAIDERTVSGLRRSVGIEVLLGIAVLTVTAMLVNAAPARSALVPNLFSANLVAGSGTNQIRINVIVDPARKGPNTIHIYTEKMDGTSQNIRYVKADIKLASQGVDQPVALQRGGPDHFLINGQLFTDTGKWTLIIHAGLPPDGTIDVAAETTVPIN